MHPILNIAIRAAQAASKTIIRSIERVEPMRSDQKKRDDFAARINEAAIEEIITSICETYPETEDAEWMVEGIDCLDNYARLIPHFATVIVYKQKDKIQHAMIYDLLKQELFTASRGKGAFCNNRRIRVSQIKELEGSLIGTNTPEAAAIAAAKKYCSGSVALDLAYAAAGRCDGFFSLNATANESSAGTFLIQEAGGLVSDIAGSENFLTTGSVVAANPKLFKAILQAI
jgi:myo-inositol-1(or 4)-monophosphatase